MVASVMAIRKLLCELIWVALLFRTAVASQQFIPTNARDIDEIMHVGSSADGRWGLKVLPDINFSASVVSLRKVN